MRVLICIAIVSILLSSARGQSPPTNSPEDYRFNFTIPEGCNRSVCDYFLAIQTNEGDPTYLDFYLEGEAQGWIAVGFSRTPSMPSADAMGCNQDAGTAMVNAVDTWNVDNTRNNEIDQTQDGVVRHAGGFDNGRIWCSFSRLIQVVNVGQDLDLNGDYFLLLGRGETPGGTGNFPVHEQRPQISAAQVNPVTDGEVVVGGRPFNLFVQAPTNPPEDYRFNLVIPEGCSRSVCDYFLAIQTNEENSTYLDFYLEGEAQGWIAVGFSSTPSMPSADAMGCNRDPGGSTMVNAVDTWNVDNTRNNEIDQTQDGVVRHAGGFDNGRIWCSFSRLIQVVNVGQDLDLNGDYFLLLGRGETSGGIGNFPVHQQTPRISEGQVNPVTDGEAVVGGRNPFVQAHGILMIIAWPVLAVTGIFFAAWMRPALPNGEWFQVHRAFLLASLFVTTVGFILVFIGFRNTSGLIALGSVNPVGTAHFVIGILVLTLQIINPILTPFRCSPKDTNRWIFNLFHGTLIGLGAELLALTNIGLGLSIYSSRDSRFGNLTIFWVYLGFVVFFIVMVGVLLVVFSILSFSSDKADRQTLAPSLLKPMLSAPPSKPNEVELNVKGDPAPASNNDPPPRKPPSKDAPVRWAALGIFLGVMIPLMLTIIVLVALP